MKIKTGDNVRILAGRDKGKTGKIIQVFPGFGRVVVEGVQDATRHLPKRGKQAGQKITFNTPIHHSNVQVVSGKTGEAGRVGYKFLEKDGKRRKVRVLKTKKGPEDLE